MTNVHLFVLFNFTHVVSCAHRVVFDPVQKRHKTIKYLKINHTVGF